MSQSWKKTKQTQNKTTDQPTNQKKKKKKEVYPSIRVKYHLNKYSKISHAIK